MRENTSMPDDDAVGFDAASAKSKRAQDAEKIRQDFVKSQRLPIAPAIQRPTMEALKDEC